MGLPGLDLASGKCDAVPARQMLGDPGESIDDKLASLRHAASVSSQIGSVSSDIMMIGSKRLASGVVIAGAEVMLVSDSLIPGWSVGRASVSQGLRALGAFCKASCHGPED